MCDHLKVCVQFQFPSFRALHLVTNGTGDTRNKLDWMTTGSLKSLNFLELDIKERLVRDKRETRKKQVRDMRDTTQKETKDGAIAYGLSQTNKIASESQR